MTIVCVDHTHIAADGIVVCGGIIISRTFKKIIRKEGRLYSMVGSIVFREPLIEWHRNGANPTDAPKGDAKNDWTLIVVDHDRSVWQYEWDAPYRERFEPPWTWGANSDVAYGLMLGGKTAAETAEIMCQMSTHVGGEIQVVNIAEALGILREAAE